MSASLALMAAGTAAQVHGQRKAQKAMSSAQEAEALRQKKLREEGEGIFNQSLGKLGADSQVKAIEEAGASRGEQMAGAQESVVPSEVKQQGEAPSVVADDTAARVSAATGKARQRALAEGFLGGYGDVSLSNALQNVRANQGIGVLNNFRQGSQGVLDYEMSNAAMAGDKWKNIGGALQAAAALTGMYGAMAPASAATTAGTSTAGTLLEGAQAKSIADAAAGMSGFNPGIQAVMDGGTFLGGTGVAPIGAGSSLVPSFLPSTMQTATSSIPSFFDPAMLTPMAGLGAGARFRPNTSFPSRARPIR
jgi:hypothetical protein